MSLSGISHVGWQASNPYASPVKAEQNGVQSCLIGLCHKIAQFVAWLFRTIFCCCRQESAAPIPIVKNATYPAPLALKEVVVVKEETSESSVIETPEREVQSTALPETLGPTAEERAMVVKQSMARRDTPLLLPEEYLRPPHIITCKDNNTDDIDGFCLEIDKINLTDSAKINIKKKPSGEVYFYHTQYEMDMLFKLHPKLCGFSGNISSFYDYGKWDFSKKLGIQYGTLPHQKPPEIIQPEIENFSGTSDEIKSIFASLLSQSKGLILGERHHHLSPKEILIEQMQSLYDQGVRTLFLEHCCYDTLQEELDNFYKTKEASAFLKLFLSAGCGMAVDTNYYALVDAAVQVGIRPVGLELSTTQKLGWSAWTGSEGANRWIGMNVPAKQIIEREQGEGKFIALVGSAHVSYCGNIAGLSELCGVPGMVIEDKKEGPPTYAKNQEHLGLDVSLPKNSEIFNNTQGKVYFTHAHLTCTPKARKS
jgi:hypothetical protein